MGCGGGIFLAASLSAGLALAGQWLSDNPWAFLAGLVTLIIWVFWPVEPANPEAVAAPEPLPPHQWEPDPSESLHVRLLGSLIMKVRAWGQLD